MAIHWGDTGKSSIGTLKTYETTLATAREIVESTPILLPTTSPSVPQVSFTIQSSDLPIIMPKPISVKYTGIVTVAGRNVSGSSQTINYDVLRNNISIATGSQTGVLDTYSWTHTHYRWSADLVVGDEIKVKVWATSENVNLDYYSIQVYPTQINVGKAYMNKDVEYTVQTGSLVMNNPFVQLSGSISIHPNTNATPAYAVNGNITFKALGWNDSYNTGRVNYGDVVNSSSTTAHATFRPFYIRNNYVKKITFREVLK